MGAIRGNIDVYARTKINLKEEGGDDVGWVQLS
jgi:hypothetical protein